KCVGLGVKSSEFRLLHRLDMHEACISFGKTNIADGPNMDEPRGSSLYDRRFYKIAALAQRPASDEDQSKLVPRSVSLDTWKHHEIGPVGIFEQFGVGRWIPTKALLHMQ